MLAVTSFRDRVCTEKNFRQAQCFRNEKRMAAERFGGRGGGNGK